MKMVWTWMVVAWTWFVAQAFEVMQLLNRVNVKWSTYKVLISSLHLLPIHPADSSCHVRCQFDQQKQLEVQCPVLEHFDVDLAEDWTASLTITEQLHFATNFRFFIFSKL